VIHTRIFLSPGAAARALADEVVRAVASCPGLVLGLPTGRTPVPFYRELVNAYQENRVNLSRVTTFNLDEFIGVRPSDPRSYRAFMQRQLFDHVNLARRRINFLNGMSDDSERECRRYERAIARAGGIDLMILGLGINGHIGFNEPGRFLIADTHQTRLTPATRRANAALFNFRVTEVPREALSIGIATILRARRIVLLATGAGKARCVERMLTGPVTSALPASFLQLHQHASVWLDRGAARRLGAHRLLSRRAELP
jgi:glucosamine-6-phosphate deaminase